MTSRAVAPLAKLAQWCLPLVHEHGRMLALKGASASEELERDRGALERAGAGNASVVESGVGLVSTPTLVISAERLRRSERVQKVRAERASRRAARAVRKKA